jgi:anti-anti-sigma regulatory factor
MREFVDSPLLGALARILLVDITHEPEGIRFPFRPLVAYTADRCTVLGRFKGQIGLLNQKTFEASLDDLVSENLSKIILDLAAVSLTKSVAATLIDFAAAMQGSNRRLYLYRPSGQVRALLKELGITAFFSYLESEDDIIATVVI